MKICFLSQYFHPEAFSNTDIALELYKRGHHVEVVCGVPNYPIGQFFDGYSNTLRSLSQGRGTISLEPEAYAPVPPDVAERFRF